MQAIRTRYHAPTNSRGARYSAQCEVGRVYVAPPVEMDNDEAHRYAMQMLCARMGWSPMEHGGVFDGDYYWTW